jgi:hypothetical protein
MVAFVPIRKEPSSGTIETVPFLATTAHRESPFGDVGGKS